MQDYRRTYPLFSLCGLNCGLCPRYQTEGKSKCPGCGGPGFNLQHPSCAVITCNKKQDSVQFCYQCSLFPCDRYRKPSAVDSFITYRHVLNDFAKAKCDLAGYQRELEEKVAILEYLLLNYNDGRRKSFYCLAVNFLELADLKEILTEIKERVSQSNDSFKDQVEQVVKRFEITTSKKNIELKLRKK